MVGGQADETSPENGGSQNAPDEAVAVTPAKESAHSAAASELDAATAAPVAAETNTAQTEAPARAASAPLSTASAHEPPPLFEQHPLAVSARVLLLSALYGFAAVAWFLYSFRSGFLPDFLMKNERGADERNIMLLALVGGTVVGGAAGSAALAWLRGRHRDTAGFERWLWFALPALFLPALSVLFRAKPWQNRHETLLPIVLLLSLAFEACLRLSLQSVPRAALQFWQQTVDQIPRLVKRHGPLLIVVAAALGYAAFFTFYLLRWHYKLRTGNFDLSINNNLMYGGLHGDFLQSPVAFPADPNKYLAAHAKFGHYLFLPIYALFPRAETLLVIQAFLIGAGSIPLFLFARRHIAEWAALLVTLAYLAYYPMHGASFSEFQNVPIAALFVFLVVWAADTRRWVWMGVFTAIALLMREDIPVGLSVIGLFLLVTGYRPIAGLVLTSVSLTYFMLLRFYVMDEAGDWWFPTMYKELWADGERGFRSVIKTLITNPLFVLSKLITEKKVMYLLHLLVPLAFLPLRRWYLWCCLIPGALLTLLVTNYDPPTSFSFHYVMHWAPYLFMGAVLALEAIGKSVELGAIRQHAALITMCGASAVLSYNYGAFAARENSFKGGFHKVEFTFSEAERARYARLQELIKIIPPDAKLAATEKVGPHVSSRRVLHTMRQGPRGADWILASSRELKLSKTKPSLKAVLEKNEYGVYKRSGDFAVFKKGHDTSGNAQLMKDWGL
jgi:uncharacterized membrane protein